MIELKPCPFCGNSKSILLKENRIDCYSKRNCIETDYCPNCGARMDGGADNE